MAWQHRARATAVSPFGLGRAVLGVVGRVAVMAALGGCAAGDDQVPTGPAAGGDPTGGGGDDGSGAGAPATTASAGNTSSSAATGSQASTGGGDGGAGGQGQGGDGGTSASQGGGGASGDGGNGGGTPDSGVLTVLATRATGAFRAARVEGEWTTSDVVGTFEAGSRPALAMRSGTTATGLLRAASDTLLVTSWNGSVWTSPAPIGGAITTGESPSLASAGDGVAHAAFHGALTDFHYYARHLGASWSPDDELVAAGGVDSFGPSAAAIAVVDGDPWVAYAGADDNLYVQERGASTWTSGIDVSGPASVDLTPAIAALAPGSDGDALVVFVASGDGSLHWTRHEPGGWTAPEAIDLALSQASPSLAATADGGAVVAWRGTNGGVYAAVFDGDAAAWSAPERVVPIITTPTVPAVATGIGGSVAELVYVEGATGAVAHVRLVGSSWSAPATVGGEDLTGVALASSP